MIYVLLHIFGTIVTLFFIFLISGFLFQVKWGYKRLDEILELAAIEKGIRTEDMFKKEHNSEMCGYLYEKYSSDRFVNRLSDMFRPILLTIDYIGYIVQCGVVVMITWIAFTDGLEIAKLAWLAVPIALFFIIIHRAIFWMCYLLTGRSAGEAKSMRKLVSEQIRIN
tara:strand:- start:33065 stop:33565 length:501 start_codon:yes stop_codon:yes gene_type:complete